MEGLFINVINMSISASFLILAVVLVRFLFKKINAPQNLRYILWALVALRLLCPFSFESAMSLLPRQDVLPEELQLSEEMNLGTVTEIVEKEEAVTEHIYGIENIVLKSDVTDEQQTNTNDDGTKNETNSTGTGNTYIDPDSTTVNSSTGNAVTETNENNWIFILSIVWAVGAIGLFAYGVLAYVKLYKKVEASIYTENNVWICDEIASPFLLGIVTPRIYMPSTITKEQMPFIIAHENEHIRCYDYLWKPLGFVLLSIHWFNPLVWLGYVLLCKDIEYACDERVIKKFENPEKKKYSESLLACSSPRHYISACPVAFGETSIKTRIKNIVDYKKPAFWVILIGIVACVVVGICFMTSPKSEKETSGDTPNYENENPGTDVNDDTTYIEDDDVYEYGQTHTAESLLYLIDVVGMEELYVQYDGEDICHIFIDNEMGVMTREDIVYYRTGETDTQKIAQKMVSVMVEKLMQPSDNRPYTITDYRVDEMDIVQGSENVWFIRYIQGAYKYDGVDMVTFEEQLEYVEMDEDGLIPFFGQGSDGNFYYILIKNGDVYRLERGANFVGKYNHLIEGQIIGSENDFVGEVDENDPYSHAIGSSWEGFVRDVSTTFEEDIEWLEREKDSDFSKWYEAYDGEDIQRIVGCDGDCDGNCSVAACCDTIYYKEKEGDDLQTATNKMIEAMILPRMESASNRTYTINDYVIGKQGFMQVSENMWILYWMDGYYAYEGIDVYEMEDAYPKHELGDKVRFQCDKTENECWYIIIKENGVYRMQKYTEMVNEKSQM